MDIVKEIIEENEMSGKLKITEKTGGGDTTDTESPDKSKGKIRSESSLDKVDKKKYENSINFIKN